MLKRLQQSGRDYVIGAGSVAQDAKLSTVGQNGTIRCSFSFQYDYDQNTKQGLYANCVAWRGLGQYASQIRRGDYISVQGKYEEYMGSDGKLYKQINADWVGIIHPDSAPAPQQAPAMTAENGFTVVDDDDLPF